MTDKSLHNFHIPVMGLAYTIDTPIRVAQYGISSVISIIDDDIIEKMRSLYSTKFNQNYVAISTKIEDYRAKRITAYLNLVDEIVQDKFLSFKKELVNKKEVLKNFVEILPSSSAIKKELQNFFLNNTESTTTLENYIDDHLNPGSIDVNIMTKVDKDNFVNNKQLPTIYNDAHASLRGFAQSNLSASVVLSAGMNPRLYSYIEEFEDFFPDSNYQLKKKIILKVSDFRSAMIQGNFLAKKGLWVSEYRIESGLNCGGHAFATEGLLLGPILEEFKNRKNELIDSAHQLMMTALENKQKKLPRVPLAMAITVQGGVGTAAEHEFLLSQYDIDSVGWGSPFLLVPEATSLDAETRKLLTTSKEKDFYLSNLSPLGILFNTVKGTSNELLRRAKELKNNFGSSCPKKFLALSKEYSPEGHCTASRKYQELKIEELNAESISNKEVYVAKKHKITEKACLCVGLVNSAYIEQNMPIKGEKQGVVICPGPNLAYFDKEVSLSQMVQHIYGKTNILPDGYRPHMFINELKMYVDHLKKNTVGILSEMSAAEQKKWKNYHQNLISGIAYYQDLFSKSTFFQSQISKINQELNYYKTLLN